MPRGYRTVWTLDHDKRAVLGRVGSTPVVVVRGRGLVPLSAIAPPGSLEPDQRRWPAGNPIQSAQGALHYRADSGEVLHLRPSGVEEALPAGTLDIHEPAFSLDEGAFLAQRSGLLGTYVVRLDLDSRKAAWKVRGSLIETRACGAVILISRSTGLVALDPSSGRKRWRAAAASRPVAIAAGGGRTWISRSPKTLVGLDDATGAATAPVHIDAATIQGVTHDGHFHTFSAAGYSLVDLATGDCRSHRFKMPPLSGPAKNTPLTASPPRIVAVDERGRALLKDRKGRLLALDLSRGVDPSLLMHRAEVLWDGIGKGISLVELSPPHLFLACPDRFSDTTTLCCLMGDG